MEGELMKICRKADKPFYFFLFSDMLIYGRKGISAGTYVLHREILIDSAFGVIDLTESEKYAFEIRNTQKSFIVYTNTNDEKYKWLEALRNCISEAHVKVMNQNGDEGAAPVWAPDKSSKNCVLCNKPFSVINRRHHCRKCGKLVDASCSKARIQLKDSKEKVRVCDTCYYEIKNANDGSEEPTIAAVVASPKNNFKQKLFNMNIDSEFKNALENKRKNIENVDSLKANAYNSEESSDDDDAPLTSPRPPNMHKSEGNLISPKNQSLKDSAPLKKQGEKEKSNYHTLPHKKSPLKSEAPKPKPPPIPFKKDYEQSPRITQLQKTPLISPKPIPIQTSITGEVKDHPEEDNDTFFRDNDLGRQRSNNIIDIKAEEKTEKESCDWNVESLLKNEMKSAGKKSSPKAAKNLGNSKVENFRPSKGVVSSRDSKQNPQPSSPKALVSNSEEKHENASHQAYKSYSHSAQRETFGRVAPPIPNNMERHSHIPSSNLVKNNEESGAPRKYKSGNFQQHVAQIKIPDQKQELHIAPSRHKRNSSGSKSKSPSPKEYQSASVKVEKSNSSSPSLKILRAISNSSEDDPDFTLKYKVGDQAIIRMRRGDRIYIEIMETKTVGWAKASDFNS
jgi:hypothetical protein